MTTINASPSHIALTLPSDKSEGAAEAGTRGAISGLVPSGGGRIAAGLVTRAAQAAVSDKTDIGKQPLLRSPRVAVFSNPVIVSWLAEKRDDPAFSADSALLAGWLAPQPDAMPQAASSNGFNVHISTKITEILKNLIWLLSDMRQAEAEMNGSMGIKAAEATVRTADSVMKDGMQKAIFGGVGASVGLVGALGGAGMKLNGLHKSKLNTTHNLDAPKLADANTASLNRALAGSRNSGIGGGGSEPELLSVHRAAFDEAINKPNNVAQTAHAKASAANQRGIDRLDVYGEVVQAIGKGAGGGITASGEYMSATETSGQSISNLASTVATKASENGRDRNKTFDNMINEMLAAIRDADNARNATQASIADRIRG